MVRFFVLPGEGQHPAILNRHDVSTERHPTSHTLGPLLSGLWLLGRTMLRRPLPPQYLTKTTYWLYGTGIIAAGLLPYDALLIRRDKSFASKILAHEGMSEHTPFRWWKRSEGISTDDCAIVGALGGWLISRGSVTLRALPKITRRFARFGAICAGAGLCSFISGIGILARIVINKPLLEEREQTLRIGYESLLRLKYDNGFWQTLDQRQRSHLLSVLRIEEAIINLMRTVINSAFPGKKGIIIDRSSMIQSSYDPRIYAKRAQNITQKSPEILGLYFDMEAPPMERLNSMIQECSVLETLLKPRLEKQIALRKSGAIDNGLVFECKYLTLVQDALIHEIFALKREEDPKSTLFDVFASVDQGMAIGAGRQPVTTIKFLETMLNSPQFPVIVGCLMSVEITADMRPLKESLHNVIVDLKEHAARCGPSLETIGGPHDISRTPFNFDKTPKTLGWIDPRARVLLADVIPSSLNDSIDPFMDQVSSPSDRKNILMKECSVIAVLMEKRMPDLFQPRAKANAMSEMEYANLFALQIKLVANVVAAELQEKNKASLNDILNSIDPGAPHVQFHSPRTSIRFLEYMVSDLRKLSLTEARPEEIIAGAHPAEAIEGMMNIIDELKKHAERAERLQLER